MFFSLSSFKKNSSRRIDDTHGSWQMPQVRDKEDKNSSPERDRERDESNGEKGDVVATSKPRPSETLKLIKNTQHQTQHHHHHAGRHRPPREPARRRRPRAPRGDGNRLGPRRGHLPLLARPRRPDARRGPDSPGRAPLVQGPDAKVGPDALLRRRDRGDRPGPRGYAGV